MSQMLKGKVYWNKFCSKCRYLEDNTLRERRCNKMKCTFLYPINRAFFITAEPECYFPQDLPILTKVTVGNGFTITVFDTRHMNKKFVSANKSVLDMTLE